MIRTEEGLEAVSAARRLRRLAGLTPVALCAALAAAAPAAAAARQWTPVATAAGPVLGDGRIVAWTDAPGRARVVQPGGSTTTIAAPPDCAGPVTAAGAARVLFHCRTDEPSAPGFQWRAHYALMPDGLRIAVDVSSYVESFVFDQVGSHWLAGPYEGYHLSSDWFYNWRTGDSFLSYRDEFGPRRYLDPSRASLERPLCRPLRRTPRRDTFHSVPAFLPLHVARTWVLEGFAGTAALHASGPPLQLRLRRCGTRRARPLGAGHSARIGSGWVTWAAADDSTDRAPGIVRALRLRDGRVLTWVTSRHARIAHTPHAVFASVPIGKSYAPSGYRVLRGALP